MENVYRFLIAGVGYFTVLALINQISEGTQTSIDIAIQSLIFASLFSVFWFVYRRFFRRG
jgi:hypothetical protein